MVPPWASTTDLTMARPRPVPPSLPWVTNGSKRLSRIMRGAPPELDPPEKPLHPTPPPTPPADPIPSTPAGKDSAERSPELNKWYVAREGFANYYFNRMHRDRVWAGWQSRGSLIERRDPWTLKGKTRSGDAFELILRDAESFLILPTGQYRIDLTGDLDQQLAPEKSGGMLLALSLWRRLAVLGPDAFGDVYYSGLAPLDDESKLWDVLIATHNVIETRFLFDPTEGSLRQLECWPLRDEDPSEIEFSYDRAVGPPGIPSLIRARHADAIYEELTIESAELPAAREPASP